MKVYFDNDTFVKFDFIDSPLTDYYQRVYKHLQHVPLQFFNWDLPYNTSECCLKLEHYASLLGINVDQSKIKDQDYLNYLHQIYEKKYDGNEQWLYYHEHIHLCEDLNKGSKGTGIYHIDWRQKAGPLTGKYNSAYTKSLVNTVKTGQIFFKWSELGKTPYVYWKNGEPNNIKRMCELAKPMLAVRPKALIACKDIYTTANLTDKNLFNNWWNQYHDEWCMYWNIPEWTLDQMFGVIPYAQTHQVNDLKYLAENNHCPVAIKI